MKADQRFDFNLNGMVPRLMVMSFGNIASSAILLVLNRDVEMKGGEYVPLMPLLVSL